MGPGISRVPGSIYASNDAFNTYKEDIFQSASDEIAFSREFTSNLFAKNKKDIVKPLILPDGNLICDFVSMPYVFTQFETASETWQQLLVQLFTNSEHSMPLMHQILDEFSVFLKQRPDNIFWLEDEDQKQKEQKNDKENTEILHALNIATSTPKINVEKLKPIIKVVDEFLKSLPRTITKDFTYHPSYYAISEFLISRLPTPNYSFPLLMWGLTCGDMGDVVYSLMHLTRSAMKKEAIQHSIDMDYYAEKIPLIPLNNAISLPFTKSIIASTNIPGTTPKDILAVQNLACDGRSVFILQENGLIRKVNLGDNFINIQERFTTSDTKLAQKDVGSLSIISLNGYLIVNGSLMHNPKLYKLDPFKYEGTLKYQTPSSFWSTPRLTSPSLTDGEYIYCYSNKVIEIWKLSPPDLIYQREIELHHNGSTLLQPFEKKVVYKDWDESSIQYISGTTYNFLICLSSQPNNIKYFARTFSLACGRHICDTIFSVTFPILSLVSDPWNGCIWATTSSSNGTMLVKMKMLGAKQQWLTGIPLAMIPKVDNVKAAFHGEHTLKGAARAASMFIQYFSTIFAGTEQKAVLYSDNYCPDISNFLCPCSDRMIKSIADTLDFFKGIYLKYDKSCPFSQTHVQKIIISLISLLQINLSNMFRRKMKEVIEQTTLRYVTDILIDIFDNDKLDFALTTTSYVFISAFPLLFNDQNARSASVFTRIYDKMSPDFVFAALKFIQNDHYFSHCFTASSCKETIGSILDSLIENQDELSQGQRELLTLFQRNMMIEIRKMYEENPGELSLVQDELQSTFFSYAKLIIDKFLLFIKTTNSDDFENKIKNSEFVDLFRKWLILLHPLSKYSRVSKELVSMLHPVFLHLSNEVKGSKLDCNHCSENNNSFLVIYSLYFEVFIVFVELIMALLEGGNELDNANDYLWLVHSTLESELTTSNFKEIADKILDQKTTKEERIKIISERSCCSNSYISMIADVFDDNNYDKYAELADKFYSKKYKHFIKKTDSKEMTTNDILTIFALSKQLNVLDELSQIISSLDKKEDIVFSYKMKSIQQIVNDGRKTQMLAKQKDAVKSNTQNNEFGNEFSLYLEELKYKLVFLLIIKPCRSLTDEESTFSTQLKAIGKFITEDIRIERCLVLVKGAEMVKMNISHGLSIITDLIDRGFNQILVCFLLDKIVKSHHFMKYLMCVKLIEKAEQDKVKPGTMPKLLSLLIKLLKKSKDPALTNLLIVLYANLVLTLGTVDLSQIFVPLAKIIKLLYHKHHKLNIDDKYMQSYRSLIITCMYSAIKGSKAKANEENLTMISKLLFPSEKIDIMRISVAHICISCGISVPYTDTTVYKFIITSPPSYYHNIFEFLTEYISKGKNKMYLIYKLLDEISNIASGSHPKLMSGFPLVSCIANTRCKHAQTPGAFFIGCSGMIHVIRHCLSIDCEAKDLITRIFNFVLDFSASNRSIKVTKEMKPFTSKKFLFGVFAVLSNVIDIPREYSLIKNTNVNSTYYTTKVDMKKRCYHGWKIPITSSSSEEIINFSPAIVPKSLLPFQPSVFPDYSHLIPFFKNAFIGKTTNYSDDALVFFILSCLSEYCTDPSFLKTLFSSGIKFELSRLSVHDNSHDFMNILRIHLASASNGFLVPPSTSTRLSYCSMSNIKDTVTSTLTDHSIIVASGAQSYVSDLLNPSSTTYFNIIFHFKCDFEIGIHFPSLHASTSETFLFKSDGVALYNGCDVENIPDTISFTNLTLAYDPINQKLHIYDGSKRIFTFNIPKGVAIFILHTFGPFDVKYSISSSSPASIPMLSFSAQSICPSAGKTVFKKRKMRVNEPLAEILNESSYIESNKQEVVPKRPVFQTLTQKRYEFIYNKEEKLNPIISYQASIIKACGHTLNISAASLIKQQMLTFPSAQLNYTSNAGTPSPTSICTEIVEKGGNLVGNFPLIMQPVFINDNTGKVSIIKDCQTKDVFTFQPLDPTTYKILPPEILNFFATGYVNRKRRDSQSQIFLHALTSPEIGVKRAIEVFNLDLPKLVEYTLTLILHIEPIKPSLIADNECPLDFNVNVISKAYHTSGPNYIYKQAIDNIFVYITEENLHTEVASIWKQLIYQQFSDCGMHFVKRGQPHAIISQLVALAEPRVIYEPYANGFLVFRTGFNSEGEILIRNKEETIKFGKGLMYINGNKLTLMHGDAEGDGVVALPVFNDSNETMLGSFFELIVSFKYFTLFLSRAVDKISTTVFREARSDVYIRFIDSYIVHSPFFAMFGGEFLEFITEKLPLTSLDDEVVVRISILAVYAGKQKNPIIKQFLDDQEATWNERIYLPLKKFFPEFLNNDEKQKIEEVKESWEVPNIEFPKFLDKGVSYNDYSKHLMRLMKRRASLSGFPFHLILKEWAIYASTYPDFSVTKVSPNEIKVDVAIKLGTEKKIKIVGNNYFNNNATFEEKEDSFLIKFSCEPEKAKKARFFLKNESETDLHKFIEDNREMFVSDISRLFYNFDNVMNNELIKMIKPELFETDRLDLVVTDETLLDCKIYLPKYLVAIRLNLLLSINWLLYNQRFKGTDSSIRFMCQFMSKQLKFKRFLQLIDGKSNDDDASFKIDRLKACDVRDGTSADLSQTFIMQLAKIYTVPKRFRKRGDKPFRIKFMNELGADDGGISKEFVLEAVKDITLSTTGLFVPVPNAQNKNSHNADTFIPIPSSRIANPQKLYKTIGVILGICIRSEIVKDIPFAPFIWEFLATGKLDIKDIYSIDSNYQELILSLKSALDMKMSESVFKQRFNLTFVAKNSLGSEIALTELGRTKPVTIASCKQYISLSNDFRIAEIKENLVSMRAGLWENLDLRPPLFVDGELLHYSCCGDTKLTVDDLLKHTEFNNTVPTAAKKQFIQVLRSFTPEQLTMLLKFSTSREKLPTQPLNKPILIIGFSRGVVDKCPTAATCFSQLYIPQYSSYEVARDLILKAISYTGTFENK